MLTLQVGAHTIKVEFVDRPQMDIDANAVYKSEYNLIRIQNDLPLSQKVTAFMHELLHVINRELDEEKTEFLAQALSQVIMSNKLFSDDFFKKLDVAERP